MCWMLALFRLFALTDLYRSVERSCMTHVRRRKEALQHTESFWWFTVDSALMWQKRESAAACVSPLPTHRTNFSRSVGSLPAALTNTWKRPVVEHRRRNLHWRWRNLHFWAAAAAVKAHVRVGEKTWRKRRHIGIPSGWIQCWRGIITTLIVLHFRR